MATKKISELPLISELSGSNEGASVIPVVVGGTTDQISIEDFSKFVNRYNATTASNNFIGNQTVNGNVIVTGKITAEEFHTEITSASIIYQSGSTQFGNDTGDTHTFLGTVTINGQAIGMGQLNAQTASQDLVNRGISSVTGSINTTTSSFDLVFRGISSVTGSINTQSGSQDLVNLRISSTTGSINTTTASFDLVFRGISSVTGAMNTQSSSQDLVNRQISLVTGSIHFTTGALNAFTGSVIGQTNTISTFTSSVNFATQSLNTQTGSQDLVNLRISSTTGSINNTTSSFDLVFRGISSVTGAINLTTSSLIGITNGLMAFTAALDTTYATDAQLYQLYQATSSVHFATQSLNTQTGSQDLVNLRISSTTGSINTTTSSFDLVFRGISSVTGAINLTTSSLIGITNGLMAFTAALDSTYATDAQIYQLYQATSSVHFATQSLNTQTGSQNAINSGISAVTGAYATTFSSIDAHILKQSIQTGSQESINTTISVVTGSLRAEIGGIESYTASLKAAEIVSSSTQIQNYYTFAQTSSANVFFGKQSVSGALHVANGVTGSFKGNLDGVAGYASTVVTVATGTTTDTSLFPVFTSSPNVNQYTSFLSHASSSFFFNGVTRRLHMEGLVVSGSNNTAEISGSLIVTGSSTVTGSVNISGSIIINSGSIKMPNRPAFRVVGTASTDRVAPTLLSSSYTNIDYNEGNYYNNSTGIFTAPIAGLYQVYFNGRCGSVNAQQQVIIYKNGGAGTVQLMWEAPGNTGVAHFGVSGITKLDVNDTLEAKVAIGSIQFDGNDSWGVAYIG